MQATRFEVRFRIWIELAVYLLGFVAPWLYLVPSDQSSRALTEPAWLEISTLLYRQGWLTYNGAVMALLAVALVFTGLGAGLRLWASAYTQVGLVPEGGVQGASLLAAGPFRRSRHPLALGTLLHTVGISLLMPPSGALFAIVALWIVEVRLALAEESRLAARLGPAYQAYQARVPRFLPAPAPQVGRAGGSAQWGRALLSELYFLGAFLTLALFGWSFDRTTLRQGLLISFGAALIARAFVPRASAETRAALPSPPRS